MRRALAAGVIAALCALSLTGCILQGIPEGRSCLPVLTAEPRTAHAGETVVIASATRCDAPRPDGGWTVLVAPSGRPDHGVRTTVTDEFDGAFRVEVMIPEGFERGEASAAIENWDYSTCEDGGGAGSCAGAVVDFVVTD